MATSDPSDGNGAVLRVHYYDRQFLGVADFTVEQGYQIDMRRRHAIGEHVWGIVCGLEIVRLDKGLFVASGMAVDGYGRDLILPDRTALPVGVADFDRQGTDSFRVWLEYDRSPFPADDDGRDFARWLELPRLRLTVPGGGAFDPRHPPGVKPEDWSFGPERTPPDSPDARWPVYLGSVRRDPTAPDSLLVDAGDRPYAGLVGAGLRTPVGDTRLELGPAPEDATRRLALVARRARDGESVEETLLAVDADGGARLKGGAALDGDVDVAGGAVALAGALTPGAEPEGWAIYRTDARELPEGAVVPAQLRIVMPAPVAAPAEATEADSDEAAEEETESSVENQVVIGSWSAADGTFTPGLTVTRDPATGRNAVTVHGDLVVKGEINPPKPSPDAATKQDMTEDAKQITTGTQIAAVQDALVQKLFEEERKIAEDIAKETGLLAKAIQALTDFLKWLFGGGAKAKAPPAPGPGDPAQKRD